MGNTSSKQSSVFEPTTNTTVSSKLKDAVSEITDTDYTLDQKQLANAQREASRQLRAAEKAAAQKIEQAFGSLKAAKPGKNESSTNELFAKVETLQKELAARPKKGTLNTSAVESRDKLAQCLENNKGKPLLCLAEFEEFKKVVELQ